MTEEKEFIFWDKARSLELYSDGTTNMFFCEVDKCDEIIKLKQENEELKIYIESNKQQVEQAELLVMDNDRLQQEVENLKSIIYYDVEKYKSALEEIRNKAKENIKEKVHNPDWDVIQDKINEVLNEG